MATIGGLPGIARTGPIGRRAARPAARSFDVAAEQTDGAAPLAAAAMPGSLDGLLAFQEREEDAAADRRASSHGQEMLNALAGVQLALLRPEGIEDGQLARLAELTRTTPFAASAGLRALTEAIGLRARIELARRERAA